MKQIIVWMVSANELLIRENRSVIEVKTALTDTNKNTKKFPRITQSCCHLRVSNV